MGFVLAALEVWQIPQPGFQIMQIPSFDLRFTGLSMAQAVSHSLRRAPVVDRDAYILNKLFYRE